MKKPNYDIDMPYHDDLLAGKLEGRKEMDTYYIDSLPGEEEIIKILLVGWYRDDISLNKLGTAIHARIKQVTDPKEGIR